MFFRIAKQVVEHSYTSHKHMHHNHTFTILQYNEYYLDKAFQTQAILTG